jgi:hypothetical protein
MPRELAPRFASISRAALVVTLFGACLPNIDIPADAQLRCAEDRDCPRDTRCIDDDSDGFGLCLGESPCLTQGSLDVVADGTPCGADGASDAVCVDGACTAPFCGDGVVDFAGGELCDPRRDVRCRADCTPTLCGDSIVDADVGETCDEQRASCVDCAVMCLGVLEGSPASFSVVDGDCNLDPDDGCECAPRRFGIDRPDARIVQQGALVDDTLYLVTVDAALAAQGQLSFRLDRAALGSGEGEPLQRVALHDEQLFMDLANIPGEDEVFVTISAAGRNEVRRIRGAGAGVGADEVVVHAATSVENAVGRITLDDANVYGAGNEGVRVFSRDGDGSVDDDVLLPSETCRDGQTGRLVSCGGVIACFGQIDGNIVTVDKVTGSETILDHVDVVPSPLGGASNAQIVFCKDDRVHWHDRAAVFAVDDDGERRLVAQLPTLVRTVGGVENAAAFGGDILIAGVTQGTFRPTVVRVDLARRVSTVILPGAYLTHDATRVVGSANANGELMVLDLTESR